MKNRKIGFTWQMMVIALSFVILHLSYNTASAQTITARAPQQVSVGQQFRLTYTVNTQDVSGFRIGKVPEEFEVLMGPSTSSQSSFQMVNGKTTHSSSVTYTYILSATKNGSFTLPAASVNADGKQISSNTVSISVVGQPQQGQGGGNGQRNRGQQDEMRDAGTAISGSDLFIKVSASKHRVVEQEPLLLTYKVYTLVDLTQLEGKMPDLQGFHTQEIPLPQEKSFKIEQFNGRNYKTVTWSQYVMFPQITGKLNVPSITFNGIVVQRNRYVDPFEAFFNGGSGYVEVKKKIVAPGIDIQVDPLPDRPANFSGGVGKFSVSATIDKTEVKTNDPVTLRVVVSGTGNLKLIKEPIVEFPKDFDRYDAKQTDKTRLTVNGVEGNMIYDYLAVPRHPGEFEIPPVEFVYYDIAAKQYRTVKTEGFTLHVEKGEGGASVAEHFSGQEDVKLLAKDIRHIKLGDTSLKQKGEYFFGTTGYWLAIAVLLVIFISLFVIFRQRAIANADVVGSRAGRANKVATKRLKQAARLMKAGKSSEFYDETLRAMWGYVGDKLSIPVAQLSQDNIRERLSERGIDETTIGLFVEAISQCEYVRFAPGDPQGNMHKVYDSAMTAIEKIDNSLRGKKKIDKSANGAATILLILVAMTFSFTSASAVTKADADSAYVQGDYHRAVALYDSLLLQGVSTELYYNQGNAYYRLDDITHAVLCYERAHQLSPGDADVRFNLQMARSKTIDKIVPESEMFFVTWYRSAVNMTSVDGWGNTALVCLALAVILALVYLFANAVWLRKVGFFGGAVVLVLFIVANVFAYSQMTDARTSRGAIIMKAAVNVKSTPSDNGTDLFILHEGTRVSVIDDSMRDWKEISVEDGKQGWLQTSQIELI